MPPATPPPENPPGALLLDAMGTLVRLDPPGPRLRRELAGRFGLTLSPSETEQAMAAEITYYRRHMHRAADPAGVDALRLAAARALRAGLPEGSRLPAVSDGALTQALLAALHFTAYPDALPALEAARKRGLRLVVVSNWDSSLPEVLDRVAVGARVDGVLTSAATGVVKPDPAIFAAALAVAGVPAAQAVHVGDSLEEDVAGARAAGIRPVWLDRTGAGAGERDVERDGGDPDMVRISSLAELALAF
jgi:putative hydrolase of the HAD superfamily